MGIGAYIGISSRAKKIKSCYVGITSAARKVKAIYAGINGVVKKVWGADAELTFRKIIPYGLSIYNRTIPFSATLPEHAMFIGGSGGLFETTVFFNQALIASYTKLVTTDNKRMIGNQTENYLVCKDYTLSESHWEEKLYILNNRTLVQGDNISFGYGQMRCGCAKLDGEVLFAGGNRDDYDYKFTVRSINNALVINKHSALHQRKYKVEGGYNNNYAIFIPGSDNVNSTEINEGSAIDKNGVCSVVALSHIFGHINGVVSSPRFGAEPNILNQFGGKVLFFRKYYQTDQPSTIDTYDDNLVKISVTPSIDVSYICGCEKISETRAVLFLMSPDDKKTAILHYIDSNLVVSDAILRQTFTENERGVGAGTCASVGNYVMFSGDAFVPTPYTSQTANSVKYIGIWEK